MNGYIYEFGCLVENTRFGWVYFLNIEKETAKTIKGFRQRCSLETGEVNNLSPKGTLFSIRKDEHIDRVTFRAGYRSDSFYIVRVSANSFDEAKQKAGLLYAKHLQDLAQKFLETYKNVAGSTIRSLAENIVSFIYQYDLFEFRDCFDDQESAVDIIAAQLSDPNQKTDVIAHLKEFAETIDEQEHQDNMADIISKIEQL